MAIPHNLKLYLSLRSPFARRVRLALTRTGIAYQEEVIEVFSPPAQFLADNPLGLVPTLVGSGGFVLSDSSMILEWIQSQTGAVFPRGSGMEWPIRQASVLCEGLMQSSVLFFQELHMHSPPSTRWLNDHFSVITETLRTVETLNRDLFVQFGSNVKATLTQAGWDLCCALEYMSFRIPSYDWSKLHPGVNAIIGLARADAKFMATVPKA